MLDQEVLLKIQAGDTNAYSLLVAKYHRQLLNFIYRLVGDKSIVEDIGQEVFLSVYKAIREKESGEEAPFAATLFLAARNRSISEIRKRQCRNEVALFEDADSSVLADREEVNEGRSEQLEIIKRCLEQLDDPYREILLQSLRGETITEMAQYHGIEAGTVKSRIFRAKKKLRKIVRQYLGGKGYERV